MVLKNWVWKMNILVHTLILYNLKLYFRLMRDVDNEI